MACFTELVYSMLAFSTPLDVPLTLLPRPKPLLTESCLVLGLVDMVTIQGVLPFLVLIFTTPEPMSPYSTEGTPVMTSTDSMLEEAMLLVLTPLRSGLPPESTAKDALSDRRTPSTSTAVPKEALPDSPLSAARMLNCLLLTRLLSVVTPPGRRLAMSPTFMTCTCSRAVLSMVREVVAALSFSLAVTTALCNRRLSASSCSLQSAMSLAKENSRERVA